MPFPLLALLPSIIAGVGAAGSALRNRRGARTTTTQPVEPPEFSPLRDLLLRHATRRLESPSALPEGFIPSGIRNINRTSDLLGQGLENRLTASGLSTSPVAGNAYANLDIARGAEINELQNVTAPMLERDLADRDFYQSLSLFGQRRPGTESVGPGSALGSGITTGMELLAYLYGSGAFGNSSLPFMTTPAPGGLPAGAYG